MDHIMWNEHNEHNLLVTNNNEKNKNKKCTAETLNSGHRSTVQCAS